MISNRIENYARKYLNKKLDEDQHELVYGLTSYWGGRHGLGKYNAFYRPSWEMQTRLILEFNYIECPSCYWAAAKADDHEYCNQLLADPTDDMN